MTKTKTYRELKVSPEDWMDEVRRVEVHDMTKADVVGEIANLLGLGAEQIRCVSEGCDLDRHVTRARFLVWYVLRLRHDWSYARIAEEFNSERRLVMLGVRQMQVAAASGAPWERLLA